MGHHDRQLCGAEAQTAEEVVADRPHLLRVRDNHVPVGRRGIQFPASIHLVALM
jgi:hypothetical protein